MKKFKLVKDNKKIIPCLSEVPENPKAVVIMVHGFTSSKSCATAELLFRRFPECGVGVVTYDQPAHGKEEARDELLMIESCKQSLACVEEYVSVNYPDAEIFYFASSFGAYITGLYISTKKHKGRKAFFRSAAVIMPELVLGPEGAEPDAEIMAELDEKGYIEPDLGLGDRIKIPRGFLEDLQQNDLFKIFDNEKYGRTDIELAHGSCDMVVPVDAAKGFAQKFGFKINIMKGENHSICTDLSSPDKVADLALNFYFEQK